MRTADLSRVLERVPGLDVTTLRDGLRIAVPAVHDAVWLVAGQVEHCRTLTAPDGGAAAEFTVTGGETLLVTAGDLVFAPARPDDVLDSTVPYRMTGAPALVAHSEMGRAAERLADAALRPGSEGPGGTDADLLLVRCLVTGALRFGMRPVRAVAHWLLARAAAGATGLPPFRAAPGWDALVREAERIALDPPVPAAPPGPGTVAAVAALTAEDFRRAAPDLTATGPDETFAAAWRARIPLTPEGLAALLLDGFRPARATVTLRPGGGGEVEIRVGGPARPRALLRLRFAPRSVELWIEEIRIADDERGSDLFPALLGSAARLAAVLGLLALCLRSAGIGGHTLAAHGFPGDPRPRPATEDPRPEAREG